MKIHITGAKGYLGQYVAQAMAGDGTVTATDVDTLDITNPGKVMDVIGSDVPDVLIHVAALKGNRPSQENPMEFYRVNTTGTLHLLEACRRFRVPRFVFVSSCTVHGPQPGTICEESPMVPLHPYGASKAAAEAFVQAYTRSYGLAAAIIRPNFIVGPIAPPMPYVDNLIYDFIRAIERDGRVVLAGDGSFEREWVHPADVSQAVRLAAVRPSEGCQAFLLGANRVSMKELVLQMIRTIGRGEVATDPRLSGFSLVSSSERARERLGWRPTKSLQDIITEIWNEYQQRKSHLH